MHFDCGIGPSPVFHVRFENGNVTYSALRNAQPNTIITFIVHQPASGGMQFSFPENLLGLHAVDLAGGSVSTFKFAFDGEFGWPL